MKEAHLKYAEGAESRTYDESYITFFVFFDHRLLVTRNGETLYEGYDLDEAITTCISYHK